MSRCRSNSSLTGLIRSSLKVLVISSIVQDSRISQLAKYTFFLSLDALYRAMVLPFRAPVDIKLKFTFNPPLFFLLRITQKLFQNIFHIRTLYPFIPLLLSGVYILGKSYYYVPNRFHSHMSPVFSILQFLSAALSFHICYVPLKPIQELR